MSHTTHFASCGCVEAKLEAAAKQAEKDFRTISYCDQRMATLESERDRYKAALEWINEKCSAASDPVAWMKAREALQSSEGAK